MKFKFSESRYSKGNIIINKESNIAYKIIDIMSDKIILVNTNNYQEKKFVYTYEMDKFYKIIGCF